ncbi:MAG: DMT family protein [Nitrospira sp.]
MSSTLVATVALLILSNLFMTLAWYGHLRFTSYHLWLAVMASWGIAFFEYCLQVPANRIGYQAFSAYQLKTLQETITLSVFIVFAEVYLGEGLKPKHLAGFVLLALAAWTIFQDRYGLEW